MKKSQKNQYLQLKQEQTNLQKLFSTLIRLFVREEKQSSEISQAVVAGTYFQIFGIINIIMLFTVFSNTNSLTYSIVISCLYVVLVLIDIFPKVAKKHYVFNFVGISEGLILLSVLICKKLIIDKYSIYYDSYLVFSAHCQSFIKYHESRQYVIGPKDEILQMCSSVSFKFITQIIVQVLFVVGKIIHLVLYFRAYRQAKDNFDENERKKRRKDRYNEMMRKRYVYNEKRKV